MKAIEDALQENIIQTHNGMGDYCAFCMLVIEDGKGHSATCPRVLALAEYKQLQWYLHDTPALQVIIDELLVELEANETDQWEGGLLCSPPNREVVRAWLAKRRPAE